MILNWIEYIFTLIEPKGDIFDRFLLTVLQEIDYQCFGIFLVKNSIRYIHVIVFS